MSTWGTDPEGYRAKGRADEEARKAAEADRAAEEKRERIWEAIYAAVLTGLLGPWLLERRLENSGPPDLELMRHYERKAKEVADRWRETVTKS